MTPLYIVVVYVGHIFSQVAASEAPITPQQIPCKCSTYLPIKAFLILIFKQTMRGWKSLPVILAEKGLPGMCLSLYLTRML